MKTVNVGAFGEPQVLEVRDAPTPELDTGMALVAVEAAGVSFADVMVRKGVYPGVSEPGGVPGLEIAGTVTAVGDGAPSDMVGKRVFAIIGSGGYAEKVAVPAAMLIPLPDNVSCAEAVALGVNAGVAYLACQRAAISNGDRVVIRGAGGGIGVIAAQVAGKMGGYVVSVTSSDSKGNQLTELGSDAVMMRDQASADETGVDVVIDAVGGPDVATFIEKLNPNGRYVMVGAVAGMPTPEFGLSLLKGFQKSLSFETFSLNSVAPEDLGPALMEAIDDAASNRVKPVVDEVFGFSDAAAAHAKMEAAEAFGKIVLAP